MIKWRLRQMMAERKIGVGELAEEIGLSRVSVSRLRNTENDEYPRISGDVLNGLCRALQCGPGDLLVYVPDEPEGTDDGTLRRVEIERRAKSEEPSVPDTPDISGRSECSEQSGGPEASVCSESLYTYGLAARKREEKAERTQHGVLVRGKLVQVVENRWQERQVEANWEKDLGTLCALAEEEGLTHLWVLADGEAELAYIRGAEVEWNLWTNWRYPESKRLPFGKKNQLVSAAGYRRSERGGMRRVSVIFPRHAHQGWRWAKHEQGREVLLTILYLERALGVAVTGSPSTVGMRLLQAYQRQGKHEDWLQEPQVEWSSLPFRWSKVAADLIAQRPLREDEHRLRYLHKIDKNGAYLRAGVAEKVGVGTPVHVSDPEQLTAIAKKQESRPGVWRCTLTSPDPAMNAPQLPFAPWDGGEWIVTPILNLLCAMGYQMQVKEGYVWEESHGVFKRWGEILWAARLGFRAGEYQGQVWKSLEARTMAEDACKQIATATIGLTSYSGFEEETFKYRPDWKAHIVGAARATMCYNILKLQREQGITPVMVYMDALYILSDEPDARKAAASLLDRSMALGGYKPEWSLVFDNQVRTILAADLEVGPKLAQLNMLVKQGEKNNDGE